MGNVDIDIKSPIDRMKLVQADGGEMLHQISPIAGIGLLGRLQLIMRIKHRFSRHLAEIGH